MEWIQKGSQGDDVLTVQKKLQAMGFDPGPIDGIFGSKTEAAVRRFQEKNNLQVDGIVGPKTGGVLGMLEKEAATDKTMMADQGRSKAKSHSPAAGVEAEKKRKEAEARKAAEKGAAANEALRAAEKKADDKAKAVEAVKKGAEKPLEDKEIGGSLWSRVFGRNRKRDR